MKTANCPSCGAPVTFRSAASILAVCDYCKSTLIRHDADLENLGKMAALLEDASPLQLAAEGKYQGTHFAVVGRIWNEWFLLFDNQRTGWLSEASGSYVLTFLAAAEAVIPLFDEIVLGQYLTLAGQLFQAVNKETATCIAGEGELPFRVGAGYPAPVIDFSSPKQFATLDYSDAEPMLFVGEEVQFPALKMTGLRARESAAGKAQIKTFNCPSCGAPQEIRAQGSAALACGSCGAVIDIADKNHKILSEYRGKLTPFPPRLPLGSQGKLRGATYDVVGFMRRRVVVEGESYEWSEYLIYSEQENFRWLSEYQGHWNFIKPTSNTPSMAGALTKPKARFLGRDFTHFQTASATVTYVIGEFYWRVKVGEAAEVMDFVAPPLMLSREKSGKEISWSLGEYIEPAEIAAAFKLPSPLPAPIGVYANQPSPHSGQAGSYWKAFWIFALLAIAIQVFFLVSADDRTVFQQSLDFAQIPKGQAITTEVFPVDGHTANLVIENRTNLDNNWLYLDINLVETGSGQSYHFGREVSYYHGYDSDGSWSEGNAHDAVVLSEIPPGNYLLQIDPETPPGLNAAMSDRIVVKRDVPMWTNFFLALLALLLFPVVAWWRSSSFERRRWAESDYAPTDSSDDSDSSDD
ncbi:hypothetical protein SKTS_21310 [Sulfurimicrobium lacus]|uniref:DUF4178 domain-containing protein n=1 Tax=Sulfurimicrobium lacus TaxID=2715678 RepID=A0A6F8VEQ9_9PROT|nr:DUF4178 domain-containing protein [Sulfurimicrobium lacus]BCB27245.1 hypothetical protein SKTS_21310 [Sulfurimicrobium lacus]